MHNNFPVTAQPVIAHKVAVNNSIILYLVYKLSRGESTSRWHSAVSMSKHRERWTVNMPSDVRNDRPVGTVACQISGPRMRGTFKKERASCLLTGKLMKVRGSCLLELHLISIVACVRVNQMWGCLVEQQLCLVSGCIALGTRRCLQLRLAYDKQSRSLVPLIWCCCHPNTHLYTKPNKLTLTSTLNEMNESSWANLSHIFKFVDTTEVSVSCI